MMSKLFHNLKKYINIFLKKKIKIFKIKQYDLLILDDGYANLNFKNIFSFLTIKNTLYFQCFLIAFFKQFLYIIKKDKYSLSYLYLKELVKKVKPKIIIGHDFKENIFKIKKEFPEIFTIIYQFSDHDIYEKKVLSRAIGPNLDLDEFKCDLYLSKNKIFDSTLNFIKAKFLSVGSVKNNELVLKNEEKKIYDIMMISQFRPGIPSFNGMYKLKHLTVTHSAFAYVSQILAKYCDKKNAKLCIAKTSARKDKQGFINKFEEEDFFKKILNSKKFYSEDIDAYSLSNKSKLIVTTYSTMGLELISRGMKVLFIDPFYFVDNTGVIKLFVDQLEGPYWYCGNDPLVIEDKIDYLLKISNEEWKDVLKKSPFKIRYDPGNSELKELVNKKINNI